MKPLYKELCPTQEKQNDKSDPPLCCCAGRVKRLKFKKFLNEFYEPFKCNCQFYTGLFLFTA